MSYTRNMTWISERKVMRRKWPYELSSFAYRCNFLCYMKFGLQYSIEYFIRRPKKKHILNLRNIFTMKNEHRVLSIGYFSLSMNQNLTKVRLSIEQKLK